MTIMQEFSGWWFHNVAVPYGEFVYFKNFGWSTITVAVIVTLILGVFYKPNKHAPPGEFMEYYGYPLSILIILTLAIPCGSVLFMFIMPLLIVFGGGIGLLFGLFLLIQWLKNYYTMRIKGE